jgi:hypothetical protein
MNYGDGLKSLSRRLEKGDILFLARSPRKLRTRHPDQEVECPLFLVSKAVERLMILLSKMTILVNQESPAGSSEVYSF